MGSKSQMPAARIGDIDTGHPPYPPTPIITGSTDVLVNGMPAARKGDMLVPHHPGPRIITEGAGTVKINGKEAARVSDNVNCGGKIIIGSPTVLIGDKPEKPVNSKASPEFEEFIQSRFKLENRSLSPYQQTELAASIAVKYRGTEGAVSTWQEYYQSNEASPADLADPVKARGYQRARTHQAEISKQEAQAKTTVSNATKTDAETWSLQKELLDTALKLGQDELATEAMGQIANQIAGSLSIPVMSSVRPPSTVAKDQYAKPQPTYYQGWGLATDHATKEYSDDIKEVFAKWSEMEPGIRERSLVGAVNKQLSKAGVPEIDLFVTPSAGGEFDFTSWNIEVDPGLVRKDTLTEAEQIELADTVYHEARHCEQWWEMARYYAGGAYDPADMGIPAWVAEKAKKNPLPSSSTKYEAAEEMFSGIYGSGGGNRNQILESLDINSEAMGEAKLKLESALADPFSSTEMIASTKQDYKSAVQAYNESYRKYRELPEEIDAWAVGTRVREYW